MLTTTPTILHEVCGDDIKVIVGYELVMSGDEDESSFEMQGKNNFKGAYASIR
jgi:hypothetical protein